MKRILLFGNSGSGKSTLAKELCATESLAHLDLDTIAWQPTSPPERMSIDDSKQKLSNIISSNESWVVEGCYTDLLELLEPTSTEIIYMNLPIDACIENARNRPWEPHKYPSKEAQDKNLDMLIEWISEYPYRTDTFSQTAHSLFYEQYSGTKRMFISNEQSR